MLWWACAVWAGDQASWSEALDQVTSGVVAIHMEVPRGFDGVGAHNGVATGFVVDEERGLVLTNRHVVTAGPVHAWAVFNNLEEVALTPVYRDPVHDFGLYRYDPAELEHMEAVALPLSPERAAVGLPIHVVGNDGGDQLQILDGTLALLDRQAPSYGAHFNDFNTFYYQAASATSGGSSGSPVLDLEGHVVALNAGGARHTAGGYFLPLHRVKRALALIQAGDPVPRGTLQTTVVYTPYDALARLGVSEEVFAPARAQNPTGKGLLLVDTVLRGGPAEGLLLAGDVVLTVEGVGVFDHVTLEAALDDHVGERITLEVARGEEVITVTPRVQDLHAITPHSFLEVGGGVLHELSYQQARVMQRPVQGISLAVPGYMFGGARLPKDAVITAVEGVDVTTLEALSEQLAGFGGGQPFLVRYHPSRNPQRVQLASVVMDRRWFDQRLCVRDDTLGRWPCEEVEVNEERWRSSRRPRPAAEAGGALGRKLQRSFVGLRVRVPFFAAGMMASRHSGVGLVVADGLLLTDRDTVPEALVDVTIEVDGVSAPGHVVAVHPSHGLALVAYDPEDLPGVSLTPVTFRPSFEEGERLSYVGWASGRMTVRDGVLDEVLTYDQVDEGRVRFRELELDVGIVYAAADDYVPGVLVDRKGRVGALWAASSYYEDQQHWWDFFGLPAEVIEQVLALHRGALRTLPWGLEPASVSELTALGVSEDWVARLVEADPVGRGGLKVRSVMAGSALSEVRPGDVLLSVNEAPVSTFLAVEQALQGQERVRIGLWRGSEALEVVVEPEVAPPVALDHVVLWSGAVVHQAHRAERLDGHDDCPVITSLFSGSPMREAGQLTRYCITAVNGQPTPDLQALLAVDRALEDGQHVRVDLTGATGHQEVVSVQIERDFWSTQELVWSPSGWVRR